MIRWLRSGGAKAMIVTAYAVTLAVAGLAAGALGALIGGVEIGDTSTMPETFGWSVAFAALAALLGFGIGLIARQGAAAISGLLVWWLVVESLASVFLDPRYGRFLPFVAGNGMIGIVNEEEATIFPPATSALIFAGYAALALAIGVVVAHRSDP